MHPCAPGLFVTGDATYAKSDAILMVNGQEYEGVNDIQGYMNVLGDDDTGGYNGLTGDDDTGGDYSVGRNDTAKGNDTENGGDEERVGAGDDDSTVNAGGFLVITFGRTLSMLLIAQIWVMVH